VSTLIIEEVDTHSNTAAEAAAASSSGAAASSGGSPPPFHSPAFTRVMAPLLPRRLRPLAQAIALASYAADRAGASVKIAPPPPPPVSVEVGKYSYE
jgi:hypothetical protein